MSSSSRISITGQWWGTTISLILITLFGVILITPLLRWTGGPCTDDGHLLYFRLAALRYAWESGAVFSRWLPDVAFGYGYPFFIFREAPPLYLGLIPFLLGIPLPAAINIFYALCILLAGWFMFLWVRDVFGPIAGVVSAVAYMAAPYLLTDVFIRGIQPETMALTLFPFICWIGRRFMISGTAGTFLASIGGIALLALSHNISTLLFVPFLIIYLFLVGKLQRLEWRPLLTRWAVVLILGLSLSAFYIIPALVELDEITINQSVNNRNNDFHFNFVTVDELLSPVSPEDPSLLNPPFLLRIGLVPAGLALLGLVSVIWNKSMERRGHIIFMALAAIVFLFMTLELSLPLWERLPLISFVQFPWRFVGRAALPIAFLVGVPFTSIIQIKPRSSRSNPIPGIIPAFAVVLLLLTALPMLYPANCRSEPFPTINDVHLYEKTTGMVGVDPTGSYFPVTVRVRPEDSPLEVDYLAGQVPRRFDESAIPSNAIITDIEYRSNAATIELDTPEPFEARYLSFAFPGWRVTIDGQEVPITPSVPEGLISFPVPAGAHTIDIRWQSTPIRTATMILSTIALIGAILIVIVLIRKPAAAVAGTETGNDYQQLEIRQKTNPQLKKIYWGYLIVALIFLGFKFLIVDRVETPLRRMASPLVSYPSDLMAGELRLEGYDLSQKKVASGETFDIDLAWSVMAPPSAEYQSNIWLVDSQGLVWTDKETNRPRTYEETGPTTFWLPGQWAWDSREVQILSGTPPGTYDIVLTLFDLADLQPITLTRPDGVIVGPTAVIGQISVDVPESSPTFESRNLLNESINRITLMGYDQDRQESSPGQQMLLTFYWEKTADLQTPINDLQLTLRDENGDVAQSWAIPPVRSDYPPVVWEVGERLRGQQLIRLAAALEDGLYRFYLEDVPLGQIRVDAPERIFQEPAFDTAVQANFDDLIQLVGYSIQVEANDPSDPVVIDLVWQGLKEMSTSYRVFVHLVNEAGQILSQSDAEPGTWKRPTTGWAIGEYILDRHQLSRPIDEPIDRLSLRVGLYDIQSGQRLETGSADSLLIPLALGEE